MIKGSRPCKECLARQHGYVNPESMLKILYWDRKMRPTEISEILGVSITAIMNWLHFYHIKVRPKGSVGRPMKYKGAMVIVFLVMFAFPSIVFSSELPAPFEAIKAMASKCKPDSDGDHAWRRVVSINGKQIGYLMLYSPKNGLVAIGRGDGPYFLVVILEEKKSEYVIEFYAYGRLSRQLTLHETQACELAYKIFRELVANKLI